MRSIERQPYVVQFLILHEYQVDSLDNINALKDALKSLRPEEKDSLLQFRVFNNDGEIEVPWTLWEDEKQHHEEGQRNE